LEGSKKSNITNTWIINWYAD